MHIRSTRRLILVVGLILVGLTVWAQTARSDAFEPNETQQAARRLSLSAAGGNFNATFHNTADQDWYRITVPAGSKMVTIYTDGELDTTLALMDRSGSTLAEADDFMGNLNAHLEQVLSGGDYLLHVGTFQGAIGSYSLTVEFSAPPAPDAYEPNDDTKAAKPLSIDPNGSSFDVNFHVGGDADWYRISVPQGALPNIRIYTAGDSDTVMELADLDGVTLASDDDSSGNGLNAEINVALPPGDYFLRVGNYDERIGSYTLSFEFVEGLESDAFEPNDDQESATLLPLAGDETYFDASFHAGEDVDWYAITVPQGGRNVNISTEGGMDTIMALFDAGFNQLAENDDAMDTNAMIQIFLQAGDYTFSVGNYAGDQGTYGLMVRFVVPPRPDAYEPDNAVAQAKPVTIGAEGQQRSFNNANDVDWVRLTITQAGTYSIRAFGITNEDMDTYVELYDSRQNQVGSDDDGGSIGLDSNLVMTLNPGTYFIKLNQLGSEIFGDGSYKLIVVRQ
ncbi:MAG: hypothetical protein A2087_02195 [Spirochaetes bacterium GWD1_61_31]|nr:MAG: hypothetical protein A2Y37_11930 [Spirochaetes bacterium GWB1_60_80]OHD33896.1 MAG: hypothetical protein A2004_01300 [Spirochaetes bacterium GWC1_61_12]OHD43833.1 MAG: hypothetical protein A2087_02195 [Spirochaetes bacterium GWD1_61_31]OHD46076.1 MAG: hypothetical protein A2Y35_13755 [Spirochaetes bacterium GWE1_60_18]OHD60648.1 MAG: hypothetical protein A2Y32_08245 [Spirochaetes bacterium GWF1_60_12]HAP44266.1 hypothetical protein [Spirochaetaceae bacterium]